MRRCTDNRPYVGDFPAKPGQTASVARGECFQVVKPFSDAEKCEHRVGEEWQFVGSVYCPYDDVCELCLSDAKGDEWLVPLKREVAHRLAEWVKSV